VPPFDEEAELGEILGLGVTHSPLFPQPAENMAFLLRKRLDDPDIPAEAKDQSKWPDAMRAEWGKDGGAAAGAAHREAMLVGLRKARARLDEFKPDFIVMWGDDQYENFREDIIPPFSILAYEQVTARPWEPATTSPSMKGKPNVWNEGPDFEIKIRCHREGAKYLVEQLLEQDFDIAYAYEPLHHKSLSHAFLNAILFLDYDRRGFQHRVIPFPINCYGREVIGYRGFADSLGHKPPPDPPSPSPRRCYDLGAAVARICRDSPYRVALLASSSWSHSFLTKKTWRMVPDIETDRRLYRAMLDGDYDYWRRRTLAEVEDAGGHETLNWFTLMGAMNELKQKCVWSDFLETYIFNATKVTAIFAPR
jgi:hypothetical protein